VLVLGAAGQLGEVVADTFPASWPIVAWTRADLDLTDGAQVMNAISDLRPAVIVNCAAYNAVDEAEEQAVTALEGNAFSVRSIARAAAAAGATLVHYSTDFVFDGEASAPYREDDRPNPRSVYAASKLLGEWFAAEASQYYVLRVESLFGGLTRQKGSLDRMIDRLAAGQPVRAFSDRIVSPTYAWDAVDATAFLLRARPAPGIYHCVNTGAATWLEVAGEVRRCLNSTANIESMTLKDARLRAPRPRYCALANDKLRAAGFAMPTWQDAVARALARRSRRALDSARGGSSGVERPEITEKS
jgi:dTDP-4-dehydrorhamnose reductase